VAKLVRALAAAHNRPELCRAPLQDANCLEHLLHSADNMATVLRHVQLIHEKQKGTHGK
jgi:hypothetical protein